MPATVISAKGVVIKHGASASPTDVLAQVKSVSVTPGERTLIETTVHSTTGTKAYINHPLRDTLEVEVTILFDPTDTGHDAIYDAYAAGTLYYFIFQLPDTGTAEWSASGTITKFATNDLPSEGDTALEATFTFKALGAETYTQ
jgi:hypothetical protein